MNKYENYRLIINMAETGENNHCCFFEMPEMGSHNGVMSNGHLSRNMCIIIDLRKTNRKNFDSELRKESLRGILDM